MKISYEFVFYVFFAIVAGYFIFRFIKHGGFKGAMFGASIEKTIGEVSGSGNSMMNLTLRVHKLEGSPDKAVGIELVATSLASYQMTPVTLSVSEVRKLRDILDMAVGE